MAKRKVFEFYNASTDFGAAAKEAYQILRTYNYSLKMFDDSGNEVYEPAEARRFFGEPRGILVSIVDEGENSELKLFIAQNTRPTEVQGLAKTLRMSAWKYKLLFTFRRLNADEIRIKDFASQHSVRESTDNKIAIEDRMDITEGMYGTSKSSYLNLPEARMIVRHTAPVNEDVPGARSRRIGSIYVEDNKGQRFLFPTNNLAPARAMTKHVSEGGSFHDDVGKAICEMAEDYRSLLRCSRHIQANSSRLDESAGEIREACRSKMHEMRTTFGKLFRDSGYHTESQRISEEHKSLIENDEAVSKKKEKAARLLELMNRGGATMDESVADRVAGLVECNCLNVSEGRKPYGSNIPMTKVLGKPVSVSAWEAFKSGHGFEDLFSAEDHPADHDKALENRLAAAKSDDDLAQAMADIGARVKDESLGNLLFSVASNLPYERDESRAKPMRAVAIRAIQLANKAKHRPSNTGLPPLANKAMAVQEFANWLNGFDPDRALLGEDAWTDGTTRNIEDEFSIEDFMVSPEYLSMIDNDMVISSAELKTVLIAYLEAELHEKHMHHSDMEEAAVRLLPKVMNRLRSEGILLEDNQMLDDDMLVDPDEAEGDISLTDDDLEGDLAADGAGIIEDLELTDEDILLPTNQKDDLVGEVTKSEVEDPDTGEIVPADDRYITRLRQLANIHSNIPR